MIFKQQLERPLEVTRGHKRGCVNCKIKDKQLSVPYINLAPSTSQYLFAAKIIATTCVLDGEWSKWNISSRINKDRIRFSTTDN